ncbi:hypothetical protein Afil01_62160 [Actinorhabdospora filicis]|uniref:Uncharacterized protein n=1 Tax=Actinorhabdospora filicis TaxID=1785913 RepID=A0A9W6WC90_9ACTN|nr:hypothetical protein [Actinorhabdospora filicis]GLZ81409.1 hypothetical protein Afil01_62160 [Actinorhabdospora filicis]
MPADLLAPISPWETVGHTSLEDVLSLTSEGGEGTTLGTLQAKALRTRYSPRTEAFGLTLQQWDTPGLRLYYGANAVTLPDGNLGVPLDPIPTIAAFLAVFRDGDAHFAIYVPKAEIFRGDDLALSDTESLAGLPISVKPVAYGSNSWTYALTPMGASTEATGATAGTPGSFTPADSLAPANLAELIAEVTASPASAWTTGQYVTLADNSRAHWTGTAWATGIAP